MTAYRLYLLFIASYFLHLPARIPALGVIRFDLLLTAIITLLILFQSKEGEDGKKQSPNPVVKYLWALIIYIIITLPLVKWPGSVINKNAELFIKAIVFFFFTVSLVDTRDKLKLVIQLFLGVQIFRVLEPLYLHVTQGYWGSFASMANWEYMNRLSGAPNDIINPNGLAFVIVTVIPLLHFLLVRASTRLRLLYFVLASFVALCIDIDRITFRLRWSSGYRICAHDEVQETIHLYCIDCDRSDRGIFGDE